MSVFHRVHVLIRNPDGEDRTLVRSYSRSGSAYWDQGTVERYLKNPAAPTHPGPAPEGWVVHTIVNVGVRYTPPGAYRDDVRWTEEEARTQEPQAWAVYDAQKAAHHWWLHANPIDPGAPWWSTYAVESVEHTDR